MERCQNGLDMNHRRRQTRLSDLFSVRSESEIFILSGKCGQKEGGTSRSHAVASVRIGGLEFRDVGIWRCSVSNPHWMTLMIRIRFTSPWVILKSALQLVSRHAKLNDPDSPAFNFFPEPLLHNGHFFVAQEISRIGTVHQEFQVGAGRVDLVYKVEQTVQRQPTDSRQNNTP